MDDELNLSEKSESTRFNLTVFQSSDKPLNKTITLKDGELRKASNGQFTAGRVDVVKCDGLQAFAELLRAGHKHVAFSLGRPCTDGRFIDSAEIVTSAELSEKQTPGCISRTKSHFAFSEEEPGLFMFDVDGSDKTPEEVWGCLCNVDPQLAFAEHLIVHSSSSYVYEESSGALLSPSSGYHIYCLVKNTADVPRYGEVFAKRSWLCGYGRIEVSRAGSFLIRQLMDACIYSPERLIFEAPVNLGSGLAQKKPAIVFRSGGVLDSSKLRDLNTDEFAEYQRLVDLAKEHQRSLAETVKSTWLHEKGQEIAIKTGMHLSAATGVAREFLETNSLSGDCILQFDRFGDVLVEEVVANPEKFDNETLADPLESEYNGGRNIAKFYWNNGRPAIHSHAHGGRVFQISTSIADADLLAAAAKAVKDDAGAHWEESVVHAARRLYMEDRASYQRLRAELKASCEDSQIREWEKEVLKSGGEEAHDVARELVNVVNVVSSTFHDERRNGYISIDKSSHSETWPLDSSGFFEWLEYFAYQKLGKSPSENTLRAVVATLQGQAKHEGELHDVYRRCAPYENGYLLDLTNDKWRVVNIQPEGWEILDESPVKFIRSNTAIAYPVPTDGNFSEFWNHVNVPEQDRTLVLTYMLDSLRPDTDFPILELTGEHGTAKSSTHTRIRQLTDPNSVPLRSAPKDVQDIYVSAGSNWQASFENMSYLSDKMQDGLCTLATGGGFATRKLYTNTEESVIEVKRPCIINGISAVATRPDLIDRIIHLELPPLDSYISKRDLDTLFQDAWPAIFAGLLDIFSETLRQLPNVSIQNLPRMGDYALLGQALHVALGDKRAFVDVYLKNRSNSLHASLDASPVSLAVWDFAKDHPEGWTGTTKRLKQILDRRLHDHEGWPKTPKGLGAALRRMGPALREVGVKISNERKRDGYHLTIEYLEPTDKFVMNVHNVRNVHASDLLRAIGREHMDSSEER